MTTEYIADREHYEKVIERIRGTKSILWIGTADIKDLHIAKGKESEPFLGLLSRLLKAGVEIRLIHAKEPGPAFREDFDRYKNLSTSLERMLCPRVHFKIIIIDGQWTYIGSANLTGAGMGMKSANHRNFETGILTNDPHLVESAMEQFDSVWRGEHCKKCGRRQYCTDPIK
jgi:phosphatidylserine/phosphatidylglycerophosphate/cardiolipin synthase-like enzyme